MIVALVGGTPVTLAEAEERLAVLRRGPRGELLPAPDTAEGRQLRRWTVQVLIAERVVAAEAVARGLSPADDPPLDPSLDPPLDLDATARLELGSVVAAVLTGYPPARALYRHLTRDITVGDDEVRRYYRANQDRYRTRRTRLVVHWHHGRPVNGGRRYPVSAAELAEPVRHAVFGAAEGARVGPIDGHTFDVGPLREHGAPFEHAAPAIRAALLDARRRRRFALWADARCAQAVLTPGFEHPGDIRHPDHTHRH
ncbi:DUF7158 domain-containing protein [Nonomuraea jiangxiensis]|uniref:[acyl-carrier-protein] S-malonyltransferase n=1 Tax=Nonomuraea jiangxiensis TaxID=633440 RepID=A0A1G8QBF9_9ACTN|nr:peptidylprolyl isomerase [Nonomuraea jiangxiensis]SDJ02041.1 [acyl-carrier-protein] S-malonyltransferase [Nonomuraea jiangxiensis]